MFYTDIATLFEEGACNQLQASVLPRTGAELNFAPVPEPVPKPPVQSGTGTRTGTRLCHPVPVPDSVTGTDILTKTQKLGRIDRG